MNKNDILAILKDWNDWENQHDIGIIRKSYIDRLDDLLHGSNQVITITGPRRAGKSYIMRQMAYRLVEKKIPKKDILFVNFEDPRFMQLNTKLLTQIFDIYKGFVCPKGIPYIFLDEIQEVEEWEKWVRMMHELKKARIIVSGSNAHLLSRELGTLLTGRHIKLTVLPLSFAEYLTFNNANIFNLRGRQTEIEGFLYRYMEHGSFPEVVLSDKKTEIILNYFDDMLTKDIFKRFHIRKTSEMKTLIKYYLSNAGNLMTFSSAARFIQIQTNTVERFSSYLEDVYLIFQMKRFSFKVKEQEKSSRKIYAIDSGLCCTMGFRFSDNRGKLAENIVYLALRQKRILNPQIELFYWKDVHHREVDFLVKEGKRIKSLIQVCWNMDDEKTKKRELRSLQKAIKELKCENALIITENFEGEEKLNGFKVKITPLWKWLLDEENIITA